MRGKFIEEAKALAQLQHEGIVKVSDVFEENGTAYYVMDYIEGKSLSQILKEEGTLPEARALQYIEEVSKALAYVHAHHRLHLDIKPGNIMVDNNDHAILIDFGASKQYDEDNGENTSTLLGNTPGFAPPEQMANDVVKFTPSSDIYALGATFYKLLTGVTPPSAHLLISGEPLRPLPYGISQGITSAINASMQLNKSMRPQSIQEFSNLLSSNNKEEDESTKLFTSLTTDTNAKVNQIPTPKDRTQQKRILKFTGIAALVVLFVLFIGSIKVSLPWGEDSVDVEFKHTENDYKQMYMDSIREATTFYGDSAQYIMNDSI